MKTLKEIEAERKSQDWFENYNWFRPVNAKCSKCGSQLYIDDSIVLTSYPPMYQYYCKECGNVETSHIRLNPSYEG